MPRFVLKKRYRFEQTVELSPPGGEPKGDFVAIFDLQTGPDERQPGLPSYWPSPGRIRDALVGWSGVFDEAGGEIRFSPESAQRLLAHDFVMIALQRSYMEGSSGLPEKNVAPSPAPGPAPGDGR